MSGFEVCLLVLLVAGIGPTLVLSSRGRPTNRLIGLELASAVTIVVFEVFTEVSGYTYELILSLVLVVLSFAGTLIYTRLLSPQSRR